jgi:2-hydroxy fatty acid dioxygenase
MGPSVFTMHWLMYFLAVVLAPFFVHLEILFALGYRPQLHHDIKNSVGVEITKLRRAEGDKKRAARAKDL